MTEGKGRSAKGEWRPVQMFDVFIRSLTNCSQIGVITYDVKKSDSNKSREKLITGKTNNRQKHYDCINNQEKRGHSILQIKRKSFNQGKIPRI